MRWLKNTISLLLALGAAALVLATLFSDHTNDYGRVSVPQGGTIHLPKGKVTMYYRLGDGSDLSGDTSGLTFQIVPAAGGPPIAAVLANGQASDVAVTRSDTIGEVGSLARLDVPSTGDYVVSADADRTPGTSYLEFGTNAGTALLERWKLLAGLVLGAVLLALIPVPRSRRDWDPEDEPSGWSSDPRAPYAG
jgi:hypothetical protein